MLNLSMNAHRANPAAKITMDVMKRLIMMSPLFWKGVDSWKRVDANYRLVEA